MIIIDYDKTVTKSDSIYLLYRSAFYYFDNRFKVVDYLYFVYFAVLSKANYITNAQFKEAIFQRIFRNRSQKDIEKFLNAVAKEESHISNLNVAGILLREMGPKLGDDIIIVTASPESYVARLLPHYQVIGTQFLFSRGDFKSLLVNCYGDEKVELLKKNKIYKWEVALSDSMSDIKLFDLATKRGYLVNGKQGVEKFK